MNKNETDTFTRFKNFLIDTIVFTVFVFLLVIILVRIFPAFEIDNVWNQRMLAFGSYFLYYFLFETLLYTTPGKLITKTKVTDKMTRSSPSVLKVFIGTLCRFIPLEVFSIFFSENNFTWHDIISGTSVISKT